MRRHRTIIAVVGLCVLIGSLVVVKAWQAASHRARLPQTQRIDAGLYLDEGQNFLTRAA